MTGSGSFHTRRLTTWTASGARAAQRPEVNLRPTTTVLRERTAQTHARVEAAVDLLAPGLTAARLADVVAHLHAFFTATEPALDRWADADPVSATTLAWPRRRRSALMAGDVRALGAVPLPLPPPVFDRIDTARAFGWLYVAEGSTLGGAVIARRITTLTDVLPDRLWTFSPYPEGPGPMWRAFGAALDVWVGDDAVRIAAVADAAATVFESLERWVTPLSGGLAA